MDPIEQLQQHLSGENAEPGLEHVPSLLLENIDTEAVKEMYTDIQEYARNKTRIPARKALQQLQKLRIKHGIEAYNNTAHYIRQARAHVIRTPNGLVIAPGILHGNTFHQPQLGRAGAIAYNHWLEYLEAKGNTTKMRYAPIWTFPKTEGFKLGSLEKMLDAEAYVLRTNGEFRRRLDLGSINSHRAWTNIVYVPDESRKLPLVWFNILGPKMELEGNTIRDKYDIVAEPGDDILKNIFHVGSETRVLDACFVKQVRDAVGEGPLPYIIQSDMDCIAAGRESIDHKTHTKSGYRFREDCENGKKRIIAWDIGAEYNYDQLLRNPLVLGGTVFREVMSFVYAHVDDLRGVRNNLPNID